MIVGCDDNLCPRYAQAIRNISAYSCWCNFGEKAVSKGLANVTGATGILQTHKAYIDDFPFRIR